jgi:CheY-like chemotaxis protein
VAKHCILVIEDDDRIRELVCRMLDRLGYSALSAVNGLDGLDALQSGGVDLVLTDLIMPEQAGYETIRQVRRLYPEIPVIAMSGWTSRDFSPLDEAQRVGADRLLEKPFRPGDLADLVHELLSARKPEPPTNG